MTTARTADIKLLCALYLQEAKMAGDLRQSMETGTDRIPTDKE